jgi:GNAT superfamily N-acetyltransferase
VPCGEAEIWVVDHVLDPATERARVRAMFVRDDWTRRGLGRRIMEACEDAARREGFRLALGATLPGVPLYAACGLEPVEEFDAVLSAGVRLPCVAMEKPVSQELRTAPSDMRARPPARDREG